MIPPPGPPQQSSSQPRHDQPTQPWWFERHPALSILLQVLACLLLAAVTVFLWIVDAEKYAVSVAVILIVLIVTMIRTPGHNAFGQDKSGKSPLRSLVKLFMPNFLRP